MMTLHIETHLYLQANNSMYMWNQVNYTKNYYTNIVVSSPYNQWSYLKVSCPHQNMTPLVPPSPNQRSRFLPREDKPHKVKRTNRMMHLRKKKALSTTSPSLSQEGQRFRHGTSTLCIALATTYPLHQPPPCPTEPPILSLMLVATLAKLAASTHTLTPRWCGPRLCRSGHPPTAPIVLMTPHTETGQPQPLLSAGSHRWSVRARSSHPGGSNHRGPN